MRRSADWTARTFLAAVVALSLTLPGAPARAEAGADAVRTLYATLLDAMRNGPTLGAHGRYAKIEPVVGRVFDLPLMTRLAVGTSWNGMNPTQQQQVTQAFERYIAAVYADRFDSYAGEKLEVTGAEQSTGGTIITSRIVKSTGEPVEINYLMRQSGGGWRIADIYLNGTISELATRRSEFSSILQTQGVNGLIATLNGKAAALGAERTS
ncbi:MAG TPA: ABC transporter substrate-binding protein [Stellaceae bacterium]|jgi:phospholipid transport system substrate-binding protein|nr:ABC transporter substrate-binding protein [Stellaceae bacterium]